jgi:hypothetical protein
MTPSAPLSRALRNANVIAWLRKQPVETLTNLAQLYAGHLGCPLDEVIPFDEPQDDEALLWVYTLFASQIES